jgi:anti-sigma regulatory factor (Ser/Thr protein kinase)
MTKSTKLLDFQFPAQPEQLCAVRQKLRETLTPLGKPEALVNCIVLAVGEACMNIIQHAYRDQRGDIILEVEKQGDDVTFRLTDFATHKTRAEEPDQRDHGRSEAGGLQLRQHTADEEVPACERPQTGRGESPVEQAGSGNE